VEAAKEIAQLDLGDDALLPEMVFITAYDQYAMEAFEHGVLDYVLKPAETERLRATVARLNKRLIQRESADPQTEDFAIGDAPSPSVQQLLHALSTKMSGHAPQYLNWLQASVGQNIQMVSVDEVLYCVSDEKYTRIQTLKQEFLIRKPIKELVENLDPQIFWQIHRSTLVNVKAIAGVQRDERGRQEVLIKGRSEKLSVSRSSATLFRAM
jgi:DNA-binding LytR/AlgR family response regulator